MNYLSIKIKGVSRYRKQPPPSSKKIRHLRKRYEPSRYNYFYAFRITTL